MSVYRRALAACSALAVFYGAALPCRAAPGVTAAQFTTAYFSNTPEAIVRILSVTMQSSTTANLRVQLNACAQHSGKTGSLQVVGVRKGQLANGQLALTGYVMMRVSGNVARSVWAIRLLTFDDIRRLGGCAAN